MGSTTTERLAFYLAAVRIAVGLILLGGAREASRQADFLGQLIRDSVLLDLDQRTSLLRSWGGKVLLENPEALAFLWRTGLWVCGLALLFGALVRPASAIAAVLVLHGWWFGPSTEHALHMLLLVCLAACGMTGSGSTLGFDATLDRSAPRWLTLAPRRRGDIF